jgi:hypothetical protein
MVMTIDGARVDERLALMNAHREIELARTVLAGSLQRPGGA